MTRTERSAFPRAVAKDRHESRTGIGRHIPKNGAGAHAWAPFAHELEHEIAALDDEVAAAAPDVDVGAELRRTPSGGRTSGPSDEERETARAFRKDALKNGVDLAAIARTSSAVSTSPTARSVPLSRDLASLRADDDAASA